MKAPFGKLSLLAVASAFVLSGCGAAARPPRAPFVAVWIAPQSAPPTAEELAGLSAAGAAELFLELGRLDWQSGEPAIAEQAAVPIPRPMPATLVVSGVWSKPGGQKSQIAKAWRERIDALVLLAQRSGALPVGVHFELQIRDGASELGAILRRLRREMPRTLQLSVALARDAVGSEIATELSESVDFVVVDVYGQPLGEAEDGGRWDLERGAQPVIAGLDKLDRPYALAAWTLGTARQRDGSGRAVAEDRSVALATAARNAQLTVRPEAFLEGIDRQVNEWIARQPARFGGLSLAPNDSIRFVRPATADLEDFLDRSTEWSGPRHVGTLLKRLPAADEPLALSASNLAAALAPGAAEPQLEIEIDRLATGAHRSRFRIVLANRNDEATDLGGLGSNYLELVLDGAVLATVDPGEFNGWEQLWHGTERRTLRALREADTLRLGATLVDGLERIESGVIEVVSNRSTPPRLSVGGSFFLPGGRELRLPVREWSLASD